MKKHQLKLTYPDGTVKQVTLLSPFDDYLEAAKLRWPECVVEEVRPVK